MKRKRQRNGKEYVEVRGGKSKWRKSEGTINERSGAAG